MAELGFINSLTNSFNMFLLGIGCPHYPKCRSTEGNQTHINSCPHGAKLQLEGTVEKQKESVKCIADEIVECAEKT